MTYRIQSFTKRGDIVLTNDWTIDRDYGFLASGYVSTSHSAQGKTVDRVLIAESAMSYPAVDQAQFYVSVSRGRKQAEIYTEDSSALREAAQKLDGRVSATELMNDSQPPRILRFERQQAEVKRETQREQELEAVNDRG